MTISEQDTLLEEASAAEAQAAPEAAQATGESHPDAAHPQQGEMPFALVYGEDFTKLPQDLYIPPDALEVFLEAFEGPLDLLLYLIRKQNFNILDIPMAALTRQYLSYVDEIRQTIQKGYRTLVTVLTKKMAEDLTEYLNEQGIRVRYMHSDVDTIERIEIIRDLRLGHFDVLVGINLLREGLDIPECGLVAILDADKEGEPVYVADHCFGCTAGSGSSCGGALG